MARINMESDDDENLLNKTLKLDINKSVDYLDKSNIQNQNNNHIDESNGNCDSIQFSCIKEPRHEFFSSLKKKNRLMVFGAKKMLY